MKSLHRRFFLKTSGLGLLPAIFPFTNAAAAVADNKLLAPQSEKLIKFFGDGEMFEPGDYIAELAKAQASTAIVKDRYGVGGVVTELEKKFIALTGKEAAIFMPSGTMANQLAIAVLSGQKSKVLLQETSHVYRDEADAAQSVFGKRLIPLSKGETYFNLEQLKQTIAAIKTDEAYGAEIGALSIENPVRRTDGRVFPFDEIKKISSYCRDNSIPLHLDGARLFIASAWKGIPVKEYAAYFDTVYISLYKYFGASGGAILCGPKAIIEQMPELIKVHGGNIYGNWTNAAMALHRLEGFEARMEQTIMRTKDLTTELNKIAGIKVAPLDGGTNIYSITLSKNLNGRQMRNRLYKEFNIQMGFPEGASQALITFNETILYQDISFIVNAFRKSIT